MRRYVCLAIVVSLHVFGGGGARAEGLSRADRLHLGGLDPSNCTWKAQALTSPRPGRGPESLGFRKDFTITARPRQAGLAFFVYPGGHWIVSVNGRPVPRRMTQLRGAMLYMVDLARHLRVGSNTVTLHREVGEPSRLVAEGVVFCKDGSTVRLLSDGTWRGGWGLPQDWEKPETDAGTLPLAAARPLEGWFSDRYRLNPPYYGHVQIEPVGMRDPLFDEEKPIALNVTLLNVPHESRPVLTYELLDQSARTEVATAGPTALTSDQSSLPRPRGTDVARTPRRGLVADRRSATRVRRVARGTVSVSPKGKLDWAGTLRQPPLRMGTYRFRLVLSTDGQEVDRRDYEVACVGPVKQHEVAGTHYEDGMDLKEVWSVDCTAEPPPGEFIALRNRDGRHPIETRVVSGSAGRYREFVGPQVFSHFAYRFKVKQLFAPHLAVIDWPDDAPRQMIVNVMETTTMIPSARGRLGFCRGEASVFCPDDHPRTNRMQQLRIIYWPNEEDEAIHIYNYQGQASAAASRIAVYEIQNDVPALKIADAGDRLIGYHTERGPYTMAMTYYAGLNGALFPYYGIAGGQLYRGWLTTTQNMIKRMRFAGQNLYVMGHFMYQNGLDHNLYPSRRYGGTYYSPHRDYVGLILRMFERNRMGLVSGIEYTFTRELMAESPATIEEVRAGAPTLFMVSREGEFWQMLRKPVVNFLHPRVQEDILTIVDELIERYGDYSAWRGINFILNSTFCGPLDRYKREPLDMGYGDYAVERFREDTGIAVPLHPQDPARFGKRYEWLMANAKQEWIDWRCRQYTKLFRKFRDRLVAARPDLKLYLCLREPQAARIRFFEDQFGSPGQMRQVSKTIGFDVDALKREPNVALSFMYMSPGTRHGHNADRGMALGRVPRTWRDLAHMQDWHDLFANDGKGGAYVFSGFTESSKVIPKGQWLWQRTITRQGYPWPPGPFVNDTFVNVLVRSNPTVMPHTWLDVQEPGGHLHEMRLFARAYRSLPNGKYRRLTGNGLDRNIWVESLNAGGVEYAYAANAQWWPLEEVTLTFADGVRVYDLIRDETVSLRDGKWTFHLGPYAVQTFRTVGRAVLSGQAEAPRSAVTNLDARLAAARRTVARAHEHEQATEMRKQPVWESVTVLEAGMAEIERHRRAGDLARAHEVATSWRFIGSELRLRKEILDAIPFLVLGPFGDPKWTQPGKRNAEVVPEYRGMETAYVPEDGTIDFAKAYTVYPGREAKWQRGLKTRAIVWQDADAASPRPYWMVAYAYTEIYVPQSRVVTFRVGSDHAIWIWYNGRYILKHGGHGTPRGGQRPAAPNQNRVNVELQKGWNKVLLKAVQRGEARVYFDITDRRGQPAEGLKFRVPATR